MTDAWQVIRIRLFERVAAGPVISLLRVEGKPAKRRTPGQRPNLVLDRDGSVTRFAAIPAPPDPRGVLRAAYSVPSALITPDSKFWLEHPDGSLTDLPAPSPGVSRSEPEPDMAQEPPSLEDAAEPLIDAPLGTGPDAEHDRRSDLLAKLAEQSEGLAEAERAAANSEQARRQAEAELAHAQTRIEALEHQLADADSVAQGQAAAALAEAQQQAAAALADAQQHAAAALAQTQHQLAEAESRSAEAELRATEAQARAIEAESRTTEAEARAAQAESRARELSDGLGVRNQELEQTVSEQQERIDTLELVAAASPEHAELERELGALRGGRASVEQELDQARDQLRIMTFERDELSRQAAAYDGVAVKARERASKAEATNEQLSERIQELETWRGELERRLAATTSELGVAKAAREADDRELRRLRLALTDMESGGDHVEGDGGESSPALAAQAAEIKELAAELAALRAQREVGGEAGSMDTLPDQAMATRIAALEAERAEIARRAGELHAALAGVLEPAQLLAKLADERLSELPDADTEIGAADDDVESISRTAERAAREQAERELRTAAHPTSSRQRPAY